MKKFFLSFLICVWSLPGYAQPIIITTVAGNGDGPGSSIGSYSGDGGPATAAGLRQPEGVATDGAGNIYIADRLNQRVRKVAPSGIITTFAGTGTGGYGGDGGAATLAKLNSAVDVAVDAAGNLYIADGSNCRVRKVNTAGIITTIAGTGTPGYTGDGGAAVLAQIKNPYGIAVDGSNNIYIACKDHIRKVNALGIITTVAGTGVAGFSGDGGLATAAQFGNANDMCVDAAGNIYIADAANNRVRKVNTAGIITTIAGTGTPGYSGDGGPATAAKLFGPVGVAIDAAGNLYIAEQNNSTIRKIDPLGIISTLAGNGTPGYAGDGCSDTVSQLGNNNHISLDASGVLYITDWWYHKVRKIGPDHTPYFTGGVSQHLYVCVDSVISLDLPLAVMDSDFGQPLSWSLLSTPVHGTALVTYANTTTGVIDTPAGLTYTAATGYMGNDSFKVVVTDCVNVSDTITIYVTTQSWPEAGTITGPSSVCRGATITLADTITGGTWSASNLSATVSSSALVTGLTPDTTTISYAVTNACGTATATSIVTVNSLPPITVSKSDSICLGSCDTFIVSSGGNPVLWSSASVSCPTCDTLVECPTVSQGYSVTTIDLNGCSDSISFLVIVDTCIKETVLQFDKQVDININPNPATSTIIVSSTDNLSSIELINTLGQIVFNTRSHSKEMQIDVSGFTSGLYLIRINGAVNRKFVKD